MRNQELLKTNMIILPHIKGLRWSNRLKMEAKFIINLNIPFKSRMVYRNQNKS